MKKFLAAILAASLFPFGVHAAKTDDAQQAICENLTRGIVAVNSTDGIFISWRLLADETDGVDFILYRNSEQIAYITDSTNYLDKNGNSRSRYSVAAVRNGISAERCAEVTPLSGGSNFLDIPLNIPSPALLADGTTAQYTPGDASAADLDGDGEYEIILKWDAAAQDNSNAGYTGNVLLDAYKLDGTHMWRIDLGKNIRAGAHYTQFIARDFDGDGIAEIAMKTAPGSVDASGNYVSEASLDTEILGSDNTAVYVNSSGRVPDGPEFYTVFDGLSGNALDTVMYPFPRGEIYAWGDNDGNRVDRFLACSANLDGENISAVTLRGYYTRMTLCAYNLIDKRLCEIARFDTNDSGMEQYAGQGNHNIISADVDMDGKDEIITGGICFDDDLTPLWCSYRGHGDALHIGDYDPTHDGLEYFSVHESGGTIAADGSIIDYGYTVYDAANGETLLHVPATRDTGRGIMANVGAGGFYQTIASSDAPTYIAGGNGVFTKGGISGASMNFRVFWDGDLYDELLDGTRVTAWNGSGMQTIFTANGCTSVNGTKATPSLSADLFGDWREELVYPLSNGSALRIFTTDIQTEYKLPTLMSDPIYRNGVAAENVGYNQPPHIGYYPIARISAVSDNPIVCRTGETPDFGNVTVTAYFAGGTSKTVDDWQLDGYDMTAEGAQTVYAVYSGLRAEIEVNTISGLSIENGIVNGVTEQLSDIFVPTVSHSQAVTAIAENSFTAPVHITIPETITYIDENAFCTGCSFTVVRGSYAHAYMKAHSLEYTLTDGGTDTPIQQKQYLVNTDFSQYPSNFRYLQSKETQSNYDYDSLTYTIPARGSGGDGHSGFSIVRYGSNQCMQLYAGRFSDSNRDSYITFNTAADISAAHDTVLSMKIRFDTSLNGGDGKPCMAYLSIRSSKGEITALSPDSLGVETDKFYNYSLIGSAGTLYEYLADESDSPIFLRRLNANAADIKSIHVLRYTSGAYSTTYNNNSYFGACSIDDLKLYTADNAFCRITAEDFDQNAINSFELSIGGITASSTNGVVLLPLADGEYTAHISAAGYNGGDVTLNVSNSSAVIVLEKTPVPIAGISLSHSYLKLCTGDSFRLSAEILPSDADDAEIIWHSSAPQIAAVTEDGTILCNGIGSAVITASTADNAYSSECIAEVGDYSASGDAAEIEILSAPQELYCDLHLTTASEPIKARVLNSDGYACTTVPRFSLQSAVTGVSVNSMTGIISITPKCTADSITIRIRATSSLTAALQIPIRHMSSSETLAEADFGSSEYSGMSMLQGSSAQSRTVDSISYNVTERSGGGDRTTGFIVSNGALLFRAGQYSTSGRHSYILLPDNGPMTDGALYTLDLDFELSGAPSPAIAISDSTTNDTALGNGVDGISAARFGSGFKANTKYHYRLCFINGSAETTVTDENANIIYHRINNTSADRISKISLISYNGFGGVGYAQAKLSNISLVKHCDSSANASLKITQDGAPLAYEDFTVSCAGQTQTLTTDLYGNAVFTAEPCVAEVNVRGITAHIPLADNTAATVDISSAKIIYDSELVWVTVPIESKVNTHHAAILATYDTDGNCIAVSAQDTSTDNDILSFDAPQGEHRCFLWDSINSMTPYYTANVTVK